MAKDYKIGYGKPPQDYQFKRGQSGNPAGRPRGSPNVLSELKRWLATPTKVKIGDVIKTISNAQAVCLAMVQKAKAGDVRAFSKIVEIIGPDIADELKTAATGALDTDLDIVRRAMARQGAETLPTANSEKSHEEKQDDK
jgi:hypothetical protein